MNANIPGLHGIHLPPPPGWWPPAPGWWLLAALVIAIVFWATRRGWRARARRQRLHAAMAQFDADIAASRDAPARLAAASVLLRRAAQIGHPPAATLGGAAWLAFLDGDDPTRPFSQGCGAALADGAFRRDLDVDIAPTLTLARTRFSSLLVDAAGARGRA
ncbi:MAG: DUF4381 family protein [Proteobacteria bacterium]|nr:DUF4381 family protein [Pseudomonadota bacterium]